MQIKEQELEAAKGLIPGSVFQRLNFFPEWALSRTSPGFHLQIPIDSSTVGSIESCLRASFGAGAFKEDCHKGLTLHVFSPPEAVYPLEAPVVWVSSGVPGAPQTEAHSAPYGEQMGAVFCGAFASHNATRLLRPLQLLLNEGSVADVTSDGAFKKAICNVLMSSTCETSVTDITALLHAAWQFEALLDDLVIKDPSGPQGFQDRWLLAASGKGQLTIAAEALSSHAGGKPELPQRAVPYRAPPTENEKCSEEYPGAPSEPSLLESSSRGFSMAAPRVTERFSASDLRLCRDIVNSVQQQASASALDLPVRQYTDVIKEFMTNSSRRVLVVQGETG